MGAREQLRQLFRGEGTTGALCSILNLVTRGMAQPKQATASERRLSAVGTGSDG